MKLSRVLTLCVAAMAAVGGRELAAQVVCAKENLVVGLANQQSFNVYSDAQGILHGQAIGIWKELGRRINKEVIFKEVAADQAGALLPEVLAGSIDAAGNGSFSLTGSRLQTYGALTFSADPSFFWSIQFYTSDACRQVPAGYDNPLTVTKNLLSNHKLIGSRRGIGTVQRNYLTFIATAPEPTGLGLTLEEANVLLDELIVEISGLSSEEIAQGLVAGDYFAVLISNGFPSNGSASYQAFVPCIAGLNDVPKDITSSSVGTGVLFSPICCQLMRDLEAALNSMILDGTFVKILQAEADAYNAYFGYAPGNPNYVEITEDPLTTSGFVQPSINYSSTSVPQAIPASCNSVQGKLPADCKCPSAKASCVR